MVKALCDAQGIDTTSGPDDIRWPLTSTSAAPHALDTLEVEAYMGGNDNITASNTTNTSDI